MLATLSTMPARQEQFGFEYKWDGVRAVAYWDGRRLTLESRNLIDITMRYPELTALGGQLGRHRAVLDGEIVALARGGGVSFGELQRRMHLSDPADVERAMKDVTICYMLFDLLHLDGRSLMSQPYRVRRGELASLGLGGDAVCMSPWQAGGGDAMFQAARDQRLEGIMAKRLDSPYVPGGRTGYWLKIKLTRRQEFVIGGWVPLNGVNMGCVGALLVGYYGRRGAAGEKLLFAGGVGTGFSDADRRTLRQMLAPLGVAASPFNVARPRPGALFVRPQLVVEVEYREWTHLGTLRHPSFKGVRMDKDPFDVVREEL